MSTGVNLTLSSYLQTLRVSLTAMDMSEAGCLKIAIKVFSEIYFALTFISDTEP